jgi:hypothetical protein
MHVDALHPPRLAVFLPYGRPNSFNTSRALGLTAASDPLAARRNCSTAALTSPFSASAVPAASLGDELPVNAKRSFLLRLGDDAGAGTAHVHRQLGPGRDPRSRATEHEHRHRPGLRAAGALENDNSDGSLQRAESHEFLALDDHWPVARLGQRGGRSGFQRSELWIDHGCRAGAFPATGGALRFLGG